MNHGKQNNDKKTIVKKWDGYQWIDLGFPDNSETGYPTLIVGEDNNPIVAAGSGVYKWNGTRWIALGYPNYQEKGTGYPPRWIAEGNNNVVIAYIDPEDTDKIQVKMCEMPEMD